MATTITIPVGRGDPVFVTLNGKKYTYRAGETVSVPDEVAALFESNDNQAVIYGRRATAPLTATERLAGETNAVPVSVDDNGNLYISNDDIAGAALDAIYVEGHKLIIPDEE